MKLYVFPVSISTNSHVKNSVFFFSDFSTSLFLFHSYWESLDFCPSPQHSTFPKKTYSHQIILCVHEWLLPDLARTLDTMPVTFAKMGLRPSFKLQYGPYGWCSSSPGRVLNDIGRNMTPASIP